MQFINFLAIFLGFLGLAIAQDAYPTTSIVSSSTETLTRTIRVSRISTVTSLMISSTTEAASSSSIIVSQNSTMSTMSPTSTKLGPSASLPAGTGGVIPSNTASPPLPTDFQGTASGLSAFGAAGAIAMAIVAML